MNSKIKLGACYLLNEAGRPMRIIKCTAVLPAAIGIEASAILNDLLDEDGEVDTEQPDANLSDEQIEAMVEI